MHDYVSGYPEWRSRPVGSILAPGFSDAIANYHRYRLVMRLSALAYVDGDENTAVTLAETLLMIDDVDRKVEQLSEGPGALILANTFKTKKLLLPLECFQKADDKIRPMLINGVASYAVYDWRSSSNWFERAIQDKRFKDGLAKDAAKAFCACALRAQKMDDKALAIAQEVKLGKNQSANPAWVLSKHAQFGIYMNADPRNHKAAIQLMQDIVDRAPVDSPDAEKALLMEAGMAESFDPELALKCYKLFRSRYPGKYADAIAIGISDVEKRIEGEGKGKCF